MSSKHGLLRSTVAATARAAIGQATVVELGDQTFGPFAPDPSGGWAFDTFSAGAALATGTGIRRVSADRAYTRLSSGVRQTWEELEKHRDQARKQSGRFFALVCVFSSVGFLFVLVGLAFHLLGNAKLAIIGVPSGIVAQTLSLVFFKKDRELRAVLARDGEEVASFQRFLALIDVAETLEKSQARDELKKEIVRSLLALAAGSANPQTEPKPLPDPCNPPSDV